jgi:hypothetical protein
MIHPVNYLPSQDFGDNPTSGLPASHWIIQQFGNYQPDGHTGVDYPCPVGTPVKAVAAGVVRHAGWMGGSYADNPWWIQPSFAGYVYVVDHGAFIGIYGHCMDGAAKVSAGQQVSEGQVLGLSGNTGASTGPHLHFEVLPDQYILNSFMSGRVNPSRYIVGSVTPQSVTITKPKEWDEMATKKEIQDAFHEELKTERTRKVLQNVVWTQVGGKRSGKSVTMWRDMVDTNTLVRNVLAVVQDSAKKSGTDVGALDADAVVDAIAERLNSSAKETP